MDIIKIVEIKIEESRLYDPCNSNDVAEIKLLAADIAEWHEGELEDAEKVAKAHQEMEDFTRHKKQLQGIKDVLQKIERITTKDYEDYPLLVQVMKSIARQAIKKLCEGEK